jgi:Phage derived protein Gp49-like (DUF891)
LLSLWKFRYYAGENGGSGFRDEFETISTQCRARFRSKLFTLAQLPPVEWREPLFKVLKGQDGISEIRFEADRVAQRPLGFLSAEMEYTLLLWAQEKSDHFIPRNACEIAKTRRIACINDRSLTRELWFSLE